MSALTEREIFSCLADNFRLAASLCDALASNPVSGPNYNSLRKCLGLIEGSARQASAWREDSRWLKIGMDAAEAHKRAGDWLRGARDPATGAHIKLSDGHRFRCFTRLAEIMRAGEKNSIVLRDSATGRVGMILPDGYDKPKISKNLVMRSRGGIILPNTDAVGHA